MALQGCCLKSALLSDKLSLTDEVVAKLRGKVTPGVRGSQDQSRPHFYLSTSTEEPTGGQRRQNALF